MFEMLSSGLGEVLLDSWNYFLHLAVILVPLFLGGSFLIDLAEDYLPPEKVERKLRGHDEGTGNVAAAVLRGHIKDIRVVEDTGQAVGTDGWTVDCCAGGSVTADQTHRQYVATATREAWSFFVDTFRISFSE